jgi:hypothetical protein
MTIFFLENDTCWLRDQEIYCVEDEFAGFFRDLESAWRKILDESDEMLEIGKDNREEMVKMLKVVQGDINYALQTFDDILVEHLRMDVFEDGMAEEEEEEAQERELDESEEEES